MFFPAYNSKPPVTQTLIFKISVAIGKFCFIQSNSLNSKTSILRSLAKTPLFQCIIRIFFTRIIWRKFEVPTHALKDILQPCELNFTDVAAVSLTALISIFCRYSSKNCRHQQKYWCDSSKNWCHSSKSWHHISKYCRDVSLKIWCHDSIYCCHGSFCCCDVNFYCCSYRTYWWDINNQYCCYISKI